jgi:hypothetical protein
MEPIQQPAPAVALAENNSDEARRDLLQRLKGSAHSAGFTLLSIIQGVALADLASVVANNYTRFALVQWLLVAPTFLLLIAAWNQITMETLVWVDVPNIEGYVLPFLLGGLELFLNHALAVNIQAWLIGMSVTSAFSSFAMWYTERNAALHGENAVLLTFLQPYRRSGMRYNIVGMTLLLLLAGLGGLGWFSWLDAALRQPGAASSSVAVLTVCWLLVFLQRHFYYWRVVIAYAQARELPKKKSQRT